MDKKCDIVHEDDQKKRQVSEEGEKFKPMCQLGSAFTQTGNNIIENRP